MNVLVLGSNGQLGRCFKDQFNKTNFRVTYTNRDQIDVTDFNLIKKKIIEISPDIVINASAYTFVDKAEEQHELANQINHIAVANIAMICSELDCWLFHISTDYVFDGCSTFPYTEDNQISPKNIYGRTKADGELAIQRVLTKYFIIRTSWVYSEYGNNFLKTMLRIGKEKNVLNIVDDQISCPTYAKDIAKIIITIMKSMNNSNVMSGIYNFSGDTKKSWAKFAEDIFKQAYNLNIISHVPDVNRIKTKDYKTLARRPHQTQLNCSKIKEFFDISPSNYRKGIYLSLASIKKLQKT